MNLMVGGRLPGGASGDDDAMVRARREVFDAGLYAPIVDAVAAAVAGAGSVLDAGCGEGTYLAAACANGADGCGIDISRTAVRLAARRHRSQRFAVASVYRMPFDDGVFDAVIDVFSPRPFHELLRVLRPGGSLVVVTPGPHHLHQLKAMVYDEPRPHVDDEVPPVGGEAVAVRFTLNLVEPALRRALLEMTPYWWSASPERRGRIERELTSVDAHMVLATYTRP